MQINKITYPSLHTQFKPTVNNYIYSAARERIHKFLLYLHSIIKNLK